VDLHASGGSDEAALAPGDGRAPKLSYAGADAPAPGDGGCGSACAPTLAYAPVDPAADAPPSIVAASAPAPIAELNGGLMRAASDGTHLLAPVRSEAPPEESLAGLVAIPSPAHGGSLPAPGPGTTPVHGPTPAPARGATPPPPRHAADHGDDDHDGGSGGSDDGNRPTPTPASAPVPVPDPPTPPCRLKPICR
jgi:hypothetical protein